LKQRIWASGLNRTKLSRYEKRLRIHQSSGMHWVGNGFPVRSVFDYNGLGRELSPLLLLDYAGPRQFPAGNERCGVGGHPHNGFETVTMAYQGELEHRDGWRTHTRARWSVVARS
jgi:redox-sensitive bicupin YhaK (pirin superfamily)